MRPARPLLHLLLGLTLAIAAVDVREARADAPKAAATGNPAPTPAGSAEPSEADLPPEVQEELRQFRAIDWKKGPTTGDLQNAQIEVPEGFLFTYGDGAKRFMELNHNPSTGNDFGVLVSDDMSWFIVFEFSDIGYVKDDEKEEIDAEAVLKSLREGTEQANAARRSRGWGSISIKGWAAPPRYEPATNNLEWATQIENDTTKNVSINHNIRILGRSGVMEATLIDGPDSYPTTLPKARKVLEGFSYKAGSRYSEWRKGDKIAEIGLIGLMTGGAVAVAAKTGLLAKLGKGVFKIGALLVAGAGALVARLFKRGNNQNDQQG